jgi:predicted dehydrogenase/threonine dehydrogenase-like Zn-dependent dehydrogenase
MKQVLQNLRDGRTILSDVPAPGPARGQLLIRTSRTLVSSGTERMLVEFGKAGWLQKARQQPDKVRMVLDKMRTDGVMATFHAVNSKLDQPLALGYCNVGTVLAVGEGVSGFAVGDRVASNGKHAEVVRVPENLCARVPDGVGDDAAAFTVLGAIALQGIRLAAPTLGECVAVSGLGLIGLLTVQLLRAQGCRVLGIDFDPARRAIAAGFGADVVDAADSEALLLRAEAFSRGRGVDAVLITASTRSSEPVRLAARMSRKRGRIVLVGVSGLELSRADFFEKELSFQVSCSYGPGRYDPRYEEQGQDYPVGFVRWTEQRNFEAVLDMLDAGALDVATLVSHRFAVGDAEDAYALLGSGDASLGILLGYPPAPADPGAPAVDLASARSLPLAAAGSARAGAPSVLVLGAGNYAGRVLLPAFKAAGARLHTLVGGVGTTAAELGRRHGFELASTDADAALASPDTNVAVIATRHELHAAQVLAALRAGKHVFCEKPLCLREDELDAIETEARARPAQRLAVGFNRRFAPQVRRMAGLLAGMPGPRTMLLTVNAGALPPDHWTLDRRVGGGRMVGEGCHFIDLMRFFAGSPLVSQDVVPLGGAAAGQDGATLVLRFADGSTGTLLYLTNGAPGFPKERIEVASGGRMLQLDNFRRLRGWGWPGFRRDWGWGQDKGQAACVAAFLASLQAGVEDAASELDALLEVSRASIRAQQALP